MCESPFTRDRAKQGNGLVERQGASCPTSRDHMTLRESRCLDKFLSTVRGIALSALLVAPSSLTLLALETSSSSDDQCRQRDGPNWPARCWERTHAIRGLQAQPCHFTREMRKKGTEPRGETKANGLASDAGPSPRGTAPRDVAVPGSLAHVDPAALPAAMAVPPAVAAPPELAAADAAEPTGEAGAAGRSGSMAREVMAHAYQICHATHSIRKWCKRMRPKSIYGVYVPVFRCRQKALPKRVMMRQVNEAPSKRTIPV